jgi:hypothetical protein
MPVFQWDAASTVLTVRPRDGLPYASGTSVDTPPRTFEVLIFPSARDLAGNEFNNLASARFSTLRRLSTRLVANQTLSGLAFVPVDPPVPEAESCDQGASVYASHSPYVQYKGFLTFDLVSLAPDIAEIESARLRVFQRPVSAMDFMNTVVDVEQARWARIEVPAFYVHATRSIGALSMTYGSGWRELDVAAGVREDVKARAANGQRAQFRLVTRFPRGAVGFTCEPGPEEPSLSMTYLAP